MNNIKGIDEQIEELKKKYNDREISLGDSYWVSEWSWSPIYDGYKEYEETIRNVENIDGYKVYTTGKNYRHYFAWDIHKTKEEAAEISNVKHRYAYDWPMKVDHRLIESSLVTGKLI